MPFADWLRALSPHIHGTLPETFRDAFRESVRELSSAGCVFIADIVRRTALAPPVKEFLPGVGFRLYQEMIDFQDDRAGQVVGEALAWIRSVCPPGVSVGLSPHAPYTVTEPLLGESMRAASREGIPLSIHCAETEEERRFCLEGTGPIRDLLDDGGYLAPGWRAPGCSPVAFLDRAGVLAPPRPGVPGALLVHLNAVDDVDLGILARRGASAVVCPGAHQYFQRGRFPLESLMKAGVSTALGTDGLSSNDVLSMWEEIRRALMLAPSLSAQQAVELATSEAARALGIDDRYGAIQPGRAASFCVVDTSFPAPALGAAAGREWLLTSGATVRESLVLSAAVTRDVRPFADVDNHGRLRKIL